MVEYIYAGCLVALPWTRTCDRVEAANKRGDAEAAKQKQEDDKQKPTASVTTATSTPATTTSASQPVGCLNVYKCF